MKHMTGRTDNGREVPIQNAKFSWREYYGAFKVYEPPIGTDDKERKKTGARI